MNLSHVDFVYKKEKEKKKNKNTFIVLEERKKERNKQTNKQTNKEATDKKVSCQLVE